MGLGQNRQIHVPGVTATGNAVVLLSFTVFA